MGKEGDYIMYERNKELRGVKKFRKVIVKSFVEKRRKKVI